MDQLPFEIPKSLMSYVEEYQIDPDTAIKKLKKQLHRRGPDAVGHFLMAWFYFNLGKKGKAIQYALKAKTFAPGSPFFDYVHYFMIHPKQFDAWIPDETHKYEQHNSFIVNTDIIHDLENLIRKLSESEHKRITINPETATEDSDLSIDSSAVDDIASDTLASIYAKQGKVDQALHLYRILSTINPEKKDFYANQIRTLKEQS